MPKNLNFIENLEFDMNFEIRAEIDKSNMEMIMYWYIEFKIQIMLESIQMNFVGNCVEIQ